MKNPNKLMSTAADDNGKYIVACLIFYVFDLIMSLYYCLSNTKFIVTEIQYALTFEHQIEFILFNPLPYILDGLLIISMFYHFIMLIISSIKSNKWKWLSISVVLMFIAECAVEATRYYVSRRPLITVYTFEVLVLFVFHAMTLSLKKEWWENWSALHPKCPYVAMAKQIASKNNHKSSLDENKRG